jgi:hypothetical protein
MKKFLILCLALAFLVVPVVTLAASAGGSANPYHLVSVKISGSHPSGSIWNSSFTPDSTVDWTLATTATETSQVIQTAKVGTGILSPGRNYYGEIVCPFAGGAYAGLFVECASADSIYVTPQVSCDKSTWLSLGVVQLLGTVDYDMLAVEASTAVTTPGLWPYMRFLINNYKKVYSNSSVTLWFNYLVKD